LDAPSSFLRLGGNSPRDDLQHKDLNGRRYDHRKYHRDQKGKGLLRVLRFHWYKYSTFCPLIFHLTLAILPDFPLSIPLKHGARHARDQPVRRQATVEGVLWLLLSALLVQTVSPRIEGGIVAGTLRQRDGSPAAGNASTLVVLTQTDAAGHYRLEDIPPGRYYIVAGPVNTPTFYPGAQNVGSGTTSDGIDFQATAESLRPAAPFGRGGRGNLQALQQMFDSLNQARPQLPMPGVPINIRVVLHEDSKNAGAPARLTLEVRRSGSVVISAVQAARDGHSIVALQPGESNISVIGLPQGYFVRSMTSGKHQPPGRPRSCLSGHARNHHCAFYGSAHLVSRVRSNVAIHERRGPRSAETRRRRCSFIAVEHRDGATPPQPFGPMLLLTRDTSTHIARKDLPLFFAESNSGIATIRRLHRPFGGQTLRDRSR
jgi:hypothetical protein